MQEVPAEGVGAGIRRWAGRDEIVANPPVAAAIRVLVERIVSHVARARDREQMIAEIAQPDRDAEALASGVIDSRIVGSGAKRKLPLLDGTPAGRAGRAVGARRIASQVDARNAVVCG